MPRIYLCFLWHMHQPFYKDLRTGEYRLPWTRLHALKDYYGMAHLLDEFPGIHQTFNLVPSMMMQVAEYAEGKAVEPLLQAACKPAEELSEAEQNLLLSMSFYADPARIISRYPRFAELYQAWQACERNLDRARRIFSTGAWRDLQVLSRVAWFDEEFLAGDPEVLELVRKGRHYSRADQELVERKEREILGRVLPVYAELSRRGQIEISTTPYYHPILPLLCDSDIAAVAHPGVPLPRRFRYPQDALKQLQMAREYILGVFGAAPAGLWPSEGSVSDEALDLASATGFEWAATDSGVLDRTLGRGAGVEGLYRPYEWRQRDRKLGLIFRDHLLSDLIGFVYSRMDPVEAAQDFLGRIRENCRPITGAGRDALVPIILDGENAWEYYERNGRPFLRELYRRITDDPQMSALAVREALARLEPQPLDHIFPGSWINANFDIWIGAEEDNKAWEYLLRARETFDQAGNVPPDRRQLAFEELLIAEGSDWCWWYGPEHHSANRPEFDQLFRDHLANAYRALGVDPPDELSRPILKGAAAEIRQEPTGLIHPSIDGEVTSYFEWLGAGSYEVDARSGAMHGKRTVVRELFFGTDGANLFVRVDLRTAAVEDLSGLEIRLRTQPLEPTAAESTAVIRFDRQGAHSSTAECAFRNVLEVRVPLLADSVRFQVTAWEGGLPLDAIPQEGWLEVSRLPPVEWLG
jgi:alpha-amylase/alpha-mannosidase (GH57 family)